MCRSRVAGARRDDGGRPRGRPHIRRIDRSRSLFQHIALFRPPSSSHFPFKQPIIDGPGSYPWRRFPRHDQGRDALEPSGERRPRRPRVHAHKLEFRNKRRVLELLQKRLAIAASLRVKQGVLGHLLRGGAILKITVCRDFTGFPSWPQKMNLNENHSLS